MSVLCPWVKLLTDFADFGLDAQKCVWWPGGRAGEAIALPGPSNRYNREGREGRGKERVGNREGEEDEGEERHEG